VIFILNAFISIAFISINLFGRLKMFKLLKLPDIVSFSNLVFGVISIFLLITVDLNLPNVISVSAAILLLAAVADGLDGYLARKYKGGSLGEHIDSLADTVSFGVAPTVLLISYCKVNSSNNIIFIACIAGIIYILCGVYRLARYNAFHTPGTGYDGIPITGASVGISTFTLFFDKFSFPNSDIILILITLIFSYIMISTIPYPKIHQKIIFQFLIVVFTFTVLSSLSNSVYAAIAPGILSFLMIIYILSPVFIKNSN